VKILMVTPYPPLRDGIASYAVQTVMSLRAQGHEVTVLSPGPSAAHQHLDLVGARGAAALAKRVRGYDRVIVQFHPDFFYPIGAPAKERALISSALAAAFRAADHVEVRLHEIDYRTGRGISPAAVATRLMWSQVDEIVVHSEAERRDFIDAFRVRPDRVVLTDHGEDFQRYTSMDRPTARRTLRVPAEAKVFLSIGFIQPHKGFDRAVDAFATVATADARLYVVGSLRVDEPGFKAYLETLREQIDATPGAELREGYVSDELFDRWIVAADCLVLPYRAIWSSGVIERARLYGTPVIATDVGGLKDQAAKSTDVMVVRDDAELAAAMAARLAGRTGTDVVSGSAARVVDTSDLGRPWPEPGERFRERLQAEITARASVVRGGPLGAIDAATPGTGAGGGEPDARAVIAKVTPVPAFLLPSTAGSGARSYLKKVVRRLTVWESREIAHQLNLQKIGTDRMVGALTDQVATLQARVRELEASGTRTAAPGADERSG
jgi:glycosyltransferase involved in cell wall biosynthesis